MKSGFIRSSLVVFQFVISIFLVIGTITVYRQLNYIQTKKIGFEKDQVIIQLPPERLHSIDDWRQVLPGGVDFLLAHNVLEHVVDPIGALRAWHEMLRDGGVAVLSVPHTGYGPDKRRLPVSMEHLLLDHLLQRQGTEFETREHVYAALCGFNKGHFRARDKTDQAQVAFETATADDMVETDLHWHVHSFTPVTFLQTIHAAAAFGGLRIDLLKSSSPTHDDPDLRNDGEVIFVYRLTRSARGPESSVYSDMAGLRAKLYRALSELERLRLRTGRLPAEPLCS
jgi:SAM-dependent methyltransferase